MRHWCPGITAAIVVAAVAAALTTVASSREAPPVQRPVAWRAALSQPPEWYAGAEAVRVADNVLLYQRDVGGWNKNIDMATVLSDAEKAKLLAEKKTAEATIDNGATHTQLRYLARVHDATKLPRFRDAFFKGMDYLLAAQYDNGGWPQYFPLRKGYYTHITFN